MKQRTNETYVQERKLFEVEGRVTLMSKQLHDSLSDQSDKVSEIQKLKMELRELKLQNIVIDE